MRIRLSFFAVFLFLFESGSCQEADSVLGKWFTEDNKGQVEIFFDQATSTYNGKIVWLKNPKESNGQAKRDINGDLVLNMVNLTGFVFEDGEWIEGKIYDPESGKTYYCTLSLVNHNKLKIRGSIDPMGWLGETQYWNRVN